MASLSDETCDAIVIGAGAAGLSAARVLAARGLKAIVVEASDRVGGRVLHDDTLCPYPIELGPEFIHGECDNKLLDLVRSGVDGRPNADVVELEWPNYYYFGKEGDLLSAEAADEQPDVAAMHEAFEALSEHNEEFAHTLPEQSLLQYFASSGLSSRVLDLADAIFANDYGADASDVGLHEVVHEQRHWAYGEKYLVLKGACLHDAMKTLAKGLDVRKGWAVESLRVLPGGRAVMVSDASGRRLIAKSAVVSVPLPVLQQGDVKFDPPMPLTHSKAVNALNMGSALKVVVRVNKRFWPDDFYDAVCADCFLPEVWLTPAAELMKPDCPPPYAIVGFVAGKRAERVGKLSDGEIARKMLLQLDAMFGTGGDPHPASDACDGYIVKNWKTHPRIGGAYSHPSLNAHGSRTAMQEAIHGAVFLAGEACHEGVNPCIHGAMETGEKAAERAAAVIASQGGARSKL